MKVAIVIPIHNEATHVEKMLDSLFGQSLNPTEVIIVDDHSSGANVIDAYSTNPKVMAFLYEETSIN